MLRMGAYLPSHKRPVVKPANKKSSKKIKKFAGREMAIQKGRRIAPTCARYGKRGYDSLSSSEGERKAFTRP